MVTGRTLITGATGGLGRILTKILLDQGREVVATGRNMERGAALKQQGAHFIACDLAKGDLSALVVGVDSIFHFAALSSPWGAYRDFIAANQLATNRLLDAAQSGGSKRFIFASTPSIYTRAAHQLNLTEDTPLPRPLVNAYAETKLAAEQAVRAAATPDFATVSLRPRAVIGPYDTVLLPRLLRAAQSGVMPLPGYGRALIEPTDARDVCAAFLAAEARADTVNGHVFNISGGQPVELAALAQHAFERLGRSVRLVPLPARVVLGIAYMVEAFARLRAGVPEPKVTLYAAKVLGWSQSFDLSAARNALHWEPRYSPFAAIDWALEGTE